MDTTDKSIQLEASAADEATQIQAQIQHYLNEIDRSHERMQQRHEEIERSKSRTRAMLAEMAELKIA